MAVSVLSLPLGYILGPQKCGYVANSSNPVRITCADCGTENTTPHGLINGDFVYIKSSVEDYNGFFYVELIDINTFNIKREFPLPFIPFIKTISGSDNSLKFYEVIEVHGWNCVHLPIIYRLSNTLWPTNSADTIRSISSVTDSNGYCNITASGDIKASGSAAALEFVKVTGSTDDDLNGVWQIVTYSSDTSFVLNIPYSSANDTALTGASIQYYYNNYTVKVQVWGGLNLGHTYYAQKPYELLTTLDLIPDDDNICRFSISDILKEHIKNSNNLLLGTLPNNLDAWTGFFIKYGEEYDDSDGTTLDRSTVNYISDIRDFEGRAVNAMLPFKDVYSGALSEYVSANSSQKFLTDFEQPTIFSGQYFDLSFIFDNSASQINFANTLFTSNITGWTNRDGTNRSTQQTFAWNSDGGNGAALADATIGGAENTKYFSAAPSGLSEWPAGNYTIEIRAKNSSIGIADAIGVSIWGMSTSFIQDTISVTGTVSFPRDSTYYIRVLNFTLPTAYPELAIAFSRLGGGGSFDIVVYVDSVSILYSPEYYEGFYPFFLQEFYKNNVLIDSDISDISAVDSGIYRGEIDSSLNCDLYDRIDVTAYKSTAITGPINWLDSALASAYTLRTNSEFTQTGTTGTNQYAAYTSISASNGDTIIVNAVVTVSGTWSGGIISLTTVITNNSNSSITSLGSQDIIVNGTYNIEFEIPITVSSPVVQRIHLLLTTLGIVSGSPIITISIGNQIKIISDDNIITETKTIEIDCNCKRSKSTGYNISWLNSLGGFNYWYFSAYADQIIDITDTEETEENIFGNWPNSYGEFADTINKNTYRRSRQQFVCRSQGLTIEQINSLKYIKSSPTVQIVNSIYDRTTVIVDSDSFLVYQEGQQDQYTISFTCTLTNDIPSQRG